MLHTEPEKEPKFLQFEQLVKLRDEAAVQAGFALRKQATEEANKAIVNFVNVHLANFFSDVQNRYTYAINFIKDAMAELDPETDYEAIGGYYITIGRNYSLIGDMHQCRDAYIKAIGVLEKRELSQKGRTRLGVAYQNLGALFIELKLGHLADEFLKKAFDVFTAFDDKARLFLTHNSLAARTDEREKKLYHFDTSIAYAKATGNVLAAAVVTGSKGSYLCADVPTEEGMACLNEAYEALNRWGHKRYLSDITQMLGIANAKSGNHDKALDYYQQSHQLFEESGGQTNQINLYRYWGDSLRAKGSLNEALEKYDQHEKHREKMQEFNTVSAVTEARLRFELEEERQETEQLQKKNKEIEEYAHLLEITNSELRQFTHVASHDLKEPLRMITNYSQLLEKSLNGKITEEQRMYIGYLNEGGTRMVKVLKDLIMLSKINASQVPVDLELNTVWNAIKFELRDVITQRNALLQAMDLPGLKADAENIYQLLLNLVNNGLYHNTSVQPVIHVNYELTPTGHRFEVHDNGPGIPKDYREKVFAIFQRLHNRDAYQGNGIGLAICKKVVDYMRGKIWIEDSPLGGACFVFIIPA